MVVFPAWSYALSLVHASVQTYYAVPYAWHAVGWMWNGEQIQEPEHYHSCMALFFVYILFDSWVHWRKLSRAYRVHHVLTAAGCLHNALCGPHVVGMCVLANEASTVFLSTKALMAKTNPYRKYCAHAFRGTFFLTRVCLNTMCFSYALEHSSWTTCGLMGSICALNLFWFGRGFVPAIVPNLFRRT